MYQCRQRTTRPKESMTDPYAATTICLRPCTTGQMQETEIPEGCMHVISYRSDVSHHPEAGFIDEEASVDLRANLVYTEDMRFSFRYPGTYLKLTRVPLHHGGETCYVTRASLRSGPNANTLRITICLFLNAEAIRQNLLTGLVCQMQEYLCTFELMRMAAHNEGPYLWRSFGSWGGNHITERDVPIPHMVPHISSPPCFPDMKTTPFSHQLLSLQRCMELEASDLQLQYVPPEYLRITSGMYFHKSTRSLVLQEDLQDSVMKTMGVRGGCLADNMGTGKTLSALMLISMGQDPVNLGVCSEDTALRLNTSLVVCPAHVCTQWQSELLTHFGTKLTYRVISTKNEFMQITYEDICGCDVLIVSWNIFSNPFFRAEFAGMGGKSFEDFVRLKNKLCVRAVNRDEASFKIRGAPNLFCLEFRRMYVDEVHELTASNKSSHREALLLLKARFRWSISATPFACRENEACVYFSLQYLLGLGHSGSSAVQSHYIRDADSRRVIASCFVRNSPECIRQQVVLPPISCEVVKVELSSAEQAVYGSYLRSNYVTQDELLQVCCSLRLPTQISELTNNCKDMQQIVRRLERQYRESIASMKATIDRKQVELRTLEEDMTRVTDARSVATLQTAMEGKRNALMELEAMLADKEAMLTYMSEQLHSMVDSPVQDCPVCYEDMGPGMRHQVVLPCAHTICESCFERLCSNGRPGSSISGNRRMACHICRRTFIKNQAMLLNPDEESPGDFAAVQKKYGTKIAQLKFEVSRLIAEDRKVIIFSRYDRMLHEIGKCLSKLDINVLYCKGSIMQKNKNLKLFRTGRDHSVLMLSSLECASGVTLTEASAIICMDLFNQDSRDVRAIEKQAISRCYRMGQQRDVKVVRIITKDTVEETIYNNIYSSINYEETYEES